MPEEYLPVFLVYNKIEVVEGKKK